jgi:endoglucanase
LFAIALALPAAAQNYLHASGNKILDSNNHAVRLTGVSWFGFETSTFCPQGLWARSMSSYLDQMQSLGINVIRVPYSTQMFDAGSTPNSFYAPINTNLVGLTPIQILDLLIAGAKSRGIKIILDRHTLAADTQEPLWYTAQYPESRWISDWQMLATRYLNNDTVIGFDLHNEPHEPATWGDGNLTTDWRLAAERAGNAILQINPKLLIFVEGYDKNDYYWWGGDLSLAGQYPVQLTIPSQLVYSIHDYPNSVSPSPWFNAANYPANLPSVWNQYWGYLVQQNVAPVWIGEFGTADQTTSDQEWFSSIAAYISANQLSFTFWCWNPNSSDTGGILESDWQTVDPNKWAIVQPLLAPLISSSTTTTASPLFQTSSELSSYTNAWWGEEDLSITNQQPVTAMALQVRIANTGGITFYDQYNTYDPSFLSMSSQITPSSLLFNYVLNAGITIPTGTSGFIGSQFNAGGTARSVTNDMYTFLTLTPASSIGH